MITFGFALNRDATILELREGLMHTFDAKYQSEREKEKKRKRER